MSALDHVSADDLERWRALYRRTTGVDATLVVDSEHEDGVPIDDVLAAARARSSEPPDLLDRRGERYRHFDGYGWSEVPSARPGAPEYGDGWERDTLEAELGPLREIPRDTPWDAAP